MANQEQVDILNQGVMHWNKWRETNPQTKYDISMTNLNETSPATHVSISKRTEIDLSGHYFNYIDLNGINLSGANLSMANFEVVNLSNANLIRADLRGTTFMETKLSGSDLRGAYLHNADLSETNLIKAKLDDADLMGAILSEADLEGASLTHADLMGTTLMGANLRGANLQGADLTGANLSHASLQLANLSGCRVHAVSAWSIHLEDTIQTDLIITDYGEPTLRVDNLEVAQLIYLLLDNPKIREVIDTIAKKAVLILGRFTPERKAVLIALKDALRTREYIPILFDFDKPSTQDLTETVSILAHLSRFIIVDLTDPNSAPYEVESIASNHIRPIQALFQPSDKAKRVFPMFPDLIRRYDWILPPYEYQDQEHLLTSLYAKVIAPAEQKAQELEKR